MARCTDRTRKGLHYLLVLICLSIFCIQSFKCIRLYLAKESVSTSRIYGTAFAEFPSISVCPNYFSAFKEDVLVKYNVSGKAIRNLQFPKVDGMSSLEFYELVTLDLDELLESFDFNFHDNFPGTKISQLKFMKESLMEESSKAKVEKLSATDWIQQNWLTLGRCYTFVIPENLRHLNVRSVTFTTSFDLLVYLHHPGQFWWVDTDTKLPVHKIEKSFVDVRHSITYAMPKTIETNGSIYTSCSDKMDFGYDACYQDNFDDKFYQEFGCLHPLIKKDLTKPVCNIGELSLEEKLRFSALHEELFEYRGQDDCISPCSNIPLNFGVPDKSPYENGSFHYRVYFKKFISVQKEISKYPFESFVAEVGGYLGLLLGVSILDFLKVPDIFVNLFNNKF